MEPEFKQLTLEELLETYQGCQFWVRNCGEQPIETPDKNEAYLAKEVDAIFCDEEDS